MPDNLTYPATQDAIMKKLKGIRYLFSIDKSDYKVYNQYTHLGKLKRNIE